MYAFSWTTMDFSIINEILHHQRWACWLHEKLESRLVLLLHEEQQQVAPFYHESAQHWDSCCLQMKVFEFLCLTKSPYSIWRTGLFVQRIHTDLLGTGRLSFILNTNHVMRDIRSHELDLELVGSFDWKLQDTCSASARWTWSEPNSLFHSCFNEIFGGGWFDMKTFSKDFSNFSMNFRNTISWKCFLKDDCIRSSLTECQSFPESKDWCRPNILCSDVSSMLYASIVHDAVHSNQSHQDPCDSCPQDQQTRKILFVSCSNFDLQLSIQSWKILAIFVHRVNRQKEYCVSLLQVLIPNWR